MEKTITISGQKVPFKVDGATPVRYRVEYNRDFFADVLSLIDTLNAVNVATQKGESFDVTKFDSTVMYNITYLLAKTANKNIGKMIDWIGTFDEFPLFELFGELQDLLLANMATIGKKNKKK